MSILSFSLLFCFVYVWCILGVVLLHLTVLRFKEPSPLLDTWIGWGMRGVGYFVVVVPVCWALLAFWPAVITLEMVRYFLCRHRFRVAPP